MRALHGPCATAVCLPKSARPVNHVAAASMPPASGPMPPKHQSRPWFPDDAKRQGYLDCAYQLGRESDLPVSRGHVLVREL